MKRSAAALVAALMWALALAGCGSTVLSDPQLRADASRICTVTQRHTNQIPVPSSPAGGAAFLRRGAASLRPELAALRALRPPKAAGAQFGIAVDAVAQQLQILERALADVQRSSDPLKTFPALARQLEPLEVRANAAWTTLQIPSCVER